MAQTVIAIQQHLDALIHHPQQLTDIHPYHLNVIQQLRPWRHLLEHKAPAQGYIQPGQRTVGGVHGSDQVNILRHAEGLFRVRQFQAQRFLRTVPLGRLDQGDQLTENARNIAPVDFIDDQHIRLIRCALRRDRLGRL
ncbi:hypothetical protein D9M69_457320 [compost metagenome]